MKRREWATVMLIIVVMFAVATHLSSTTLEYNRYNVQWNGTSQFFSNLEERDFEEVTSYTALAGRHDSVLLIIAPGSDFTSKEVAECREFLDGGNSLLIADEEGGANALLKQLGSDLAIIPCNLSSVDMEYNEPRSVIGYRSSGANDLAVSGVETIICNRPSSVSGGECLIATSILSWVDEDGDFRMNGGETLQRHSLFSAERIGNGRIYALSDPSIFINSMQGIDRSRDNQRLIGNLIALSPHLLVDQVHSETSADNGILDLMNGAKKSVLIEFTALIIFIFGLALAFNRRIL